MLYLLNWIPSNNLIASSPLSNESVPQVNHRVLLLTNSLANLNVERGPVHLSQVPVVRHPTVQCLSNFLAAVEFCRLGRSLVLRLHREVCTARDAAARHRSQPALAPRATAALGVHFAQGFIVCTCIVYLHVPIYDICTSMYCTVQSVHSQGFTTYVSTGENQQALQVPLDVGSGGRLTARDLQGSGGRLARQRNLPTEWPRRVPAHRAALAHSL